MARHRHHHDNDKEKHDKHDDNHDKHDDDADKDPRSDASVVIVGGGFAGVACAKGLAKAGVHVTLIDKNNYHQFQPMLYQLATAQIATNDIARPLRGVFRKEHDVHIVLAEVESVDAKTKQVVCSGGDTFEGDFLVLAMGSRPNFFGIPGAEEHSLPLYTVADAQRLRSRILTVFEDADRDPSLLDQGALNFVIVGAGATGVETAGSLADLVHEVMPDRYHSLDVDRARIVLVDPAPVVLAPFSDHAHAYAEKVLLEKRIELQLGASVTAVADDRVTLSDGSEILTHCVVWAGGIQGAALAAHTGIEAGRGGRLDVGPDLAVPGFPGVYALGDTANTPDGNGKSFPQLGSVALQAGTCAADNIVAEIDGKSGDDFRYHDKGIMAMIGRNAAVAEVGEHRHELHGSIAFAAWLGVHALLMSGVRQRIDAFVSWAWDYFSESRASSILDRPDESAIDWGDEDDADT